MKELKLEHKYHWGNWYWVCPVCKELLVPHEAGKGKGHFVLQSKGVATKHLMKHNAGYVPKGKSTTEITSKNQYFCNKCDSYVLPIKTIKSLTKILDSIITQEHKYVCFTCCEDDISYKKGLKTKDEVHKGKR